MIVANEREGSMLDNNQHLHVVSEIFSKSHKAMKKEAGNRNKWRRDRRRKSVIKQKSEAKHNDLWKPLDTTLLEKDIQQRIMRKKVIGFRSRTNSLIFGALNATVQKFR